MKHSYEGIIATNLIAINDLRVDNSNKAMVIAEQDIYITNLKAIANQSADDERRGKSLWFKIGLAIGSAITFALSMIGR